MMRKNLIFIACIFALSALFACKQKPLVLGFNLLKVNYATNVSQVIETNGAIVTTNYVTNYSRTNDTVLGVFVYDSSNKAILDASNETLQNSFLVLTNIKNSGKSAFFELTNTNTIVQYPYTCYLNFYNYTWTNASEKFVTIAYEYTFNSDAAYQCGIQQSSDDTNAIKSFCQIK